jgi:hypothetical protein
MATDMRARLEGLLDQYDEARRASEQRNQQIKLDETQFQERFRVLCRDVIRPVFESAGELLRQRGHDFSIVEELFAREGGRTVEASITVRIVAAGASQPQQADGGDPWTLSFTTRHYNRTVWMAGGAAMRAGGVSNANAAFQLSQIDTELVENQLLALIAGIVKG